MINLFCLGATTRIRQEDLVQNQHAGRTYTQNRFISSEIIQKPFKIFIRNINVNCNENVGNNKNIAHTDVSSCNCKGALVVRHVRNDVYKGEDTIHGWRCTFDDPNAIDES